MFPTPLTSPITLNTTPLPATEQFLQNVTALGPEAAAKVLRRIDKYHRYCDTIAIDATCSRLSVGVVLVKDDTVISTGYNGAPRGFAHCDHSRCTTHDTPWGSCARDLALNAPCVQSDTRAGHCQNVVHADMNALIRCKTDAHGSEMYLTATPCWECFKACVNAGVNTIVAKAHYKTDPRIYEGARRAGIIFLGPEEIALIRKLAASTT